MPRLAEAGYTVLAPDLRGIGDSAPAASDTFGAMVAYASRHRSERSTGSERPEARRLPIRLSARRRC